MSGFFTVAHSRATLKARLSTGSPLYEKLEEVLRQTVRHGLLDVSGRRDQWEPVYWAPCLEGKKEIPT
jgi:hypothetical protein